MATATSFTINIGTLGLDMYDRAAKQLVWRGSGEQDARPEGEAREPPEKPRKGRDEDARDLPTAAEDTKAPVAGISGDASGVIGG